MTSNEPNEAQSFISDYKFLQIFATMIRECFSHGFIPVAIFFSYWNIVLSVAMLIIFRSKLDGILILVSLEFVFFFSMLMYFILKVFSGQVANSQKVLHAYGDCARGHRKGRVYKSLQPLIFTCGPFFNVKSGIEVTVLGFILQDMVNLMLMYR